MALSQLLPFNENRFDACMAYLAKKHQRLLTKYDMVKLHVMTDIFHVVEQGKPVIGGSISAWTFGPVVEKAFNRLTWWEKRYIESGAEPESFRFADGEGRYPEFDAKLDVDEQEFSKTELDAMEAAWMCVMSKNWKESQEYFHSTRNFIGRAWNNAQKQVRDLDWEEIVANFEEENGLTHPAVKTLMRF